MMLKEILFTPPNPPLVSSLQAWLWHVGLWLIPPSLPWTTPTHALPAASGPPKHGSLTKSGGRSPSTDIIKCLDLQNGLHVFPAGRESQTPRLSGQRLRLLYTLGNYSSILSPGASEPGCLEPGSDLVGIMRVMRGAIVLGVLLFKWLVTLQLMLPTLVFGSS